LDLNITKGNFILQKVDLVNLLFYEVYVSCNWFGREIEGDSLSQVPSSYSSLGYLEREQRFDEWFS